MKSIQNKLSLIITIGLLVTMGLSGYIVIKYDGYVISISHLSDKTNEINKAACSAQISFKTQIQEWKNILLRGYDKNFYKKYHRSFLLNEQKTIHEAERLAVISGGYPELQNNAIKFIEEHKKLGILYREGLLIYKKTTHDPQLSADKHVRGIDREPIRLLSHIVELSTIIYEAEENNNKEKLSNIKFTIFSSYIVTFIILLVFLWFSVRKGVTQPFLRNQEESLRNHQLAMTDALTNIANRHAYNERITIEIEHFHRHKLPFTLLVLDIDRFKSINDNYGHEVGDEVIRGIANTLKMYVRKNDFVARYGGEEFVIVLTNSNITISEDVANKIRKLIERIEYCFNNERVLITVSVGLAEIQINETQKELFKRADSALYEAKKLGRNKCVKAVNTME